MKIVKVTWRDSHRYMYQMSQEDDVETTEIETVGWLIRKQNKDLVIAQDIFPNGDMRGVMVIPHENIIKFEDKESV